MAHNSASTSKSDGKPQPGNKELMVSPLLQYHKVMPVHQYSTNFYLFCFELDASWVQHPSTKYANSSRENCSSPGQPGNV